MNRTTEQKKHQAGSRLLYRVCSSMQEVDTNTMFLNAILIAPSHYFFTAYQYEFIRTYVYIHTQTPMKCIFLYMSPVVWNICVNQNNEPLVHLNGNFN